jgi:hypothetical protein
MGMPTLVELDDYAREAWSEFIESSDAMDNAKQRHEKARQAIITFLTMSDADVGEIDGEAVVKMTRVDRNVLDIDALREAEPFLARKYTRVSTSVTLRRVRG